MITGGESLAVVAAVVMGIGGSAVGAIGTVVELAVKEIDQEKRPIWRTIGEVFAKTMQCAAAAFALVILGSLVANGAGIIALNVIGAVIILTPIINGIVKHQGNETWKNFFEQGDKVASVTAKTINTAVLTAAIFMSLGIPAGIIGGIALSALNIVTYKKA